MPLPKPHGLPGGVSQGNFGFSFFFTQLQKGLEKTHTMDREAIADFYLYQGKMEPMWK